MNNKAICGMLIALFLSVGFSSCDKSKEEIGGVQELTLSSQRVFLKWYEKISPNSTSKTINILTGNGDYKLEYVDGSDALVDAEIDANQININPLHLGSGRLMLTDKEGKKAEIRFVINHPYLLFKIGSSVAADVKCENKEVHIAIMKEIVEQSPLHGENVYELYSEGNVKHKVNVYKDMASAARGGRAIKEGTFSLNSDAPLLTMTFGNVADVYGLGGVTTPFLYGYFGVPMNFGKRVKSSPPVFQRLYYDMTASYQNKYPEAGVELARIEIYGQLFEYKFIP